MTFIPYMKEAPMWGFFHAPGAYSVHMEYIRKGEDGHDPEDITACQGKAMKPVCVYGNRTSPNAPYHVYINTPPGFGDGIYLSADRELNRLSVIKGNIIIHKKFRTFGEAEAFYFSTRPDSFCPMKKYGSGGVAVAYTDGSFSELEDRYSYGAYIVHDGGEYELCGKLDGREKKFRNVAGEVEAVRQALAFCAARDIRAVEVRHDFRDLAAWADRGGGNELAQSFHRFCEGIRNAGMKVTFSKIRAHSGDRSNNRADRLSRALWNTA